MFPHFPEPKQRDTKPETPLDIRTSNQAIESRAKIVMLDVTPRQPGRAFGLREVRISLLRQHQAISRMGTPRGRLLAAIAQALQAILPNGFEHSKPRFVVSLL